MAALQYKDDHNKIAYLGRERGCEDFTDILSYLDHSPLRYALTHAPPVVFDSLVKQFWATAVVRPNAAGSHDLVATIAGREVVVTESLIRTQLHFDDANGIFNMPNSDILEVHGSTAEAHLNLSPPVFPDWENPQRERQPETEWVVPNPVSPLTDWRPWPSVPAHSPIRGPTPEPASPPTPPAQTFIFEEPLVFGPPPRPAGGVDPDVLKIISGPHPDPWLYSPVRPDDAPTPTADAAGRAEDPTLLTSLSEKLDRCMGRIDSLETELGTTKKIMGGLYFFDTCLSS
ncbi:hypothetical protein Tco_0688357 [Tanacetum coccineum]